MVRRFLILFLILSLPSISLAATFAGQETLTLSTTPVDNVYLAGGSVTVTTDLPADLSALGTSIQVYAPVAGDVLAVGGGVTLAKEVKGDVRAFAGKVLVTGNVAGDIVSAGGTVNISSRAKNIYVAGGDVEVTGGATGPVTIYGADILLSGKYDGDVEIVASNKFTVAENTRIKGTLRYNAPTQVTIPPSSEVLGGVTYTGAYSYVPTNDEARSFAILGAGIFFLVRMVSAMIIAALFVGLFPVFTRCLMDMLISRSFRRGSLLALLGFGIAISTPILLLILLISFVGIGVAFILGALYLLLLLIAHAYVGVLIGALLRRNLLHRVRGRNSLTWKDAVLGTGLLYILSLAPYIGTLILVLLMAFVTGAISTLVYRFAFAPDTQE
jgi:cytoskeletal protein CcmA (bactofilin family)